MIDFFQTLIPPHTSIQEYKVHLATGQNTVGPLVAFVKGEFKQWQEIQSKRNFERPYILSLISYDVDEWLFAGVYRRLECVEKGDNYEYKTELMDIHTELIGRLVIAYRKSFRQSYPYLENCINEFRLSQILKSRYNILEFPGYERVIVKFEFLQAVYQCNEQTWRISLNNIKGVYLICDVANGKKYVGSAYGQFAFWSRWQQYVETGHGGNVELKAVIDTNGFEYARNFQFSILEICSNLTGDEVILQREQHWKRVLMTNLHGYNSN